MSLLEDILEFNEQFVEKKEYEKFETTKFPNKKMAVLTCMDTRLVELLPHAMNVKNGDIKLVKSAGALVSHPFGSIMRSLLVAIYELKADEICVVGHHDCGMSKIDSGAFLEKAVERGIPEERIQMLKYAGVDLDTWLKSFHTCEDSVRDSVDMIKNHPLMPRDVPVHGLVIDPSTGKLDLVVDGNKK
ncbi:MULTISPECIES: beta-class carbonic anhydrase [Bacillus]|uniref:carbonic anhydrase n=2 Tax=Bacillus TaxID=1386 RepID=A0A0M3R9V7_9BACI|nr:MULTISPECIES: carbonic anhydrase [Bacillus]ALC82096.1 carbonic anhydrase [Bacillus gobiensis]MBP1083445.1 carbonic anhydrase [Bacillus capparidis]MED1097877.1 carbonic anhydrase [Bacillus capparidis]